MATIDGTDDADDLQGGDGPDTLNGGAGDDTLHGGGDGDLLTADSGNNTAYGGDGADTITMGSDDDMIYGGAEGDSLSGGDGNDLFFGDSIDLDTFLLASGPAGVPRQFTLTNASDQTIFLAFIDEAGDVQPVAWLEPGESLDQASFEGYNWAVFDGESGQPLRYLGSPDDGATLTFLPGADTIHGGDGSDTVLGEGGADSIFGDDGDDHLYGGLGDDTLSGGEGDDSLEGGAGDDSLSGGAGDDTLFGDDGADTLAGGDGDDAMFGGEGDDVFQLSEGFGQDTIDGGEGDEYWEDWVDARNVVSDAQLVYTDTDAGTLTAGGSVAEFVNVERFGLGSGNDLVDGTAAAGGIRVHAGAGDDTMLGGSGDDTLIGGVGADRLVGGAGNDFLNLGTSWIFGDGEVDTVVLADGSGNDVLQNFEAPVANGDGTYAGVDQLDVSGLTGPDGAPVTTTDVVVSDTNGDGTGHAVLTFPGGESLVLEGVSVSQVGSPQQLAAMGIPPGQDFMVTGTAGNDLINIDYAGDPHGDRVDAGDNADGTDDDRIDAGEGDDTVKAGAGNDTVFGGAGDDVLYGETGDDVLSGGTGNDRSEGGTGSDRFVLEAQFARDTVIGGTDSDGSDVDVLDATALATDLTVDLTGAGAGRLVDAADPANEVSFAEVEHIALGSGDDRVTASDPGAPITLSGGAGRDTLVLDGTPIDPAMISGLDDNVTGTFTPANGGDPVAFGPSTGLTLSQLLATSPNGAIALTGAALSGQIGGISFSEFEALNFNVICFRRGTLITTDRGERPVEVLRPGDGVWTLDNGLQAIRWIGRARRRAVGPAAPVCIRAGALGNGRDLWVSQQHRMLLRGWQASLMFGEAEVLATAKSLIDGRAVRCVPGRVVEYYHLLFDRHEIVLAEGILTESYHPGAQGWQTLEAATRAEVLALFPELARGGLGAYGPAARHSLREFEGRALARVLLGG